MIASRIGVIVAALIALVLAVILVVDLGRTGEAPTSRALAGDLDTMLLSRLAWSRGGQPEVVIERAGADWKWVRPVAGVTAEASTVDATIAALRAARWHRRAAIAKAGTLRVALQATASNGRTVKIAVGAPLSGAGQTWLAIGDHAYLVDDWVARALAPDPLALRESRPMAAAATSKTIVIDRATPQRFAVRIEGSKLVRPIDLRIDPAHMARLRQALAQMTIREIPQSVDPEIVMTISIDTPELVTLEVRTTSTCKDMIAISGSFGHACISREDHRAIDEAVNAIRTPSLAIVDQAPARIEPVRITLPDGAVLDLEKRARIGDRDADPDQVAELIALLHTTLEAVDSDAATKPLSTLSVTNRLGETIELELLPGKLVRRKGEPVALVLGDGGWKILTRPSSALGDPTLWSEDELTISTITFGAKTYARGAVVGEWTGTDDDALVTELARALAKPRAFEAPRPPGRTQTLTFTTAPPSGAPVTRTLQIGANCIALVDGRAVVMGPALCDAVGKLVR